MEETVFVIRRYDSGSPVGGSMDLFVSAWNAGHIIRSYKCERGLLSPEDSVRTL